MSAQQAYVSADVNQTPESVSAYKRRRRHENLIGYVYLSPWLIGFLVFTFVPIIASFVLAFTKYDILSAPKWIGFDNFERMLFKDSRYWQSVRVTFHYVFTAIPLRLVFALIVAMLLNTKRKMIPAYRAMYYAPSIVGGSIAVAVMWGQIFGKTGLVNYILAGFGIQGLVWLSDVRTAIWPLIILAAWQFGSPMLIFLAGLKQIPTELYESAGIDGAGSWSRFLKITLPMLTPVILFNLVMQMISGFLVFSQAFILSNGLGDPMDSLLVYALYLYQQAFVNFKMGYSAAMAWALLLVVAFFTAIVFKTSQYWVFYESEGGE